MSAVLVHAPIQVRLTAMRSLVPLILLLLTLDASAAVYRWVDSRGVTHYSDKPVAGAEEIKPQKPMVIPSQPVPQIGSSDQNEPDPAKTLKGLTFVTPTQGSTIREASANFQVILALDPAGDLPPGHTIQVTLDGQTVMSGATGLAITLPGISRGEHQLSADLFNLRGDLVASTANIIFYVQQHSIRH